jgi:hypothetical protein
LFFYLREKREGCQIPVEKKRLLLVPIPTMKMVNFSMNKFHSIKEVLRKCVLGLTLLERVDLFGKFLKFKLELGFFDQFGVVKGYW